MPPSRFRVIRTTSPSATASAGVPRGARMSRALCVRPPERRAAYVSVKSPGATPSTGMSRRSVEKLSGAARSETVRTGTAAESDGEAWASAEWTTRTASAATSKGLGNGGVAEELKN